MSRMYSISYRQKPNKLKKSSRSHFRQHPSIQKIIENYQEKKSSVGKLKYLLLNKTDHKDSTISSNLHQKKLLGRKYQIREVRQSVIRVCQKNIQRYDKLRKTIKQKKFICQNSTSYNSQKLIPILERIQKINSQKTDQKQFKITKKRYAQISTQQFIYEDQQYSYLNRKIQQKINSMRARAKTDFSYEQERGWE